ncbi:MAG TPA: type II secretion system protein [Dehalococcoidales bacterium]|nr:type II secretion system protein [Dehalococcoidales bacterium]
MRVFAGLFIKCQQLKNQSGIGLVESLVAIAILGVSAVAFITGLSTGAVSVNTLDQEVTAHRLMTSQMEELKAERYDSSGRSYQIIKTPANYSISLNVKTIENSDSDLQSITVSVSYRGSLLSKLETYKANW